VQRVEDGNDLDALDRAIRVAKEETGRPSLIIVRTHIAFGSPNRQDTAQAHGEPLGVDEVRLTKQNLGWPSEEPFHVPGEALAEWRKCRERGDALHADWQERYQRYASAHAADAAELDRRIRGEPADGWDAALPVFTPEDGKLATRAASGKVLNAIAARVPELMGGSADLAPSTKTILTGSADFSASDRAARNMRFGIREHAMGACLNGMALHGGVLPYGATFLVFSDYMRPSIRLASLMELHVIYVFTHDSIGLGEDGPTHQPIEQLAALRAIPHLTLVRPADANETAMAWRIAVTHRNGPVALALTRQGVPSLDRARFAPAQGALRGGYILSEAESDAPDLVLVASGSEVHVIIRAQEVLKAQGIHARVVSMPSLEVFARQVEEYREQVLPSGVRRIAVEAAHPMSWYELVGDRGAIIGLERFGASAPWQRVYQELGLTAENVVAHARRLLGR
jgi:transketolase